MIDGNSTEAAQDWASKIHPIYPQTSNPNVQMSKYDYIDYANAVRYYILGQGGLQKVESDQQTVEGDLALMQ